MARIVTVTAALALGLAAFSASEASARGFGGRGFGGFGHHHGFHHHHHHGFGHRFGWGPRYVAVVPAYVGTCRVKRYVDEDGDLLVRRICD